MTGWGARLGRLGLCVAVVAACGNPPRRIGSGAKVRIALARALPAMEGSGLRTTLLEIDYEPGGSSVPHRHPCAVIGYVIEGVLRSVTRGGPDTSYSAGESFYEPPNTVHQVSANASDTHPVRFTAFFICDHDRPLSVPVPETSNTEGRER